MRLNTAFWVSGPGTLCPRALLGACGVVAHAAARATHAAIFNILKWHILSRSNDLPFTSERQGRLRAYHGREEPRAQPAASRHQPTCERAHVACGCCNGLLAVGRRATLITMRTFTAVIERDPDTGLFVGYVPGWPGAHSQGVSVDELRANLEEVVAMLLEDGEPKLEGEFIGTQTVKVA